MILLLSSFMACSREDLQPEATSAEPPLPEVTAVAPTEDPLAIEITAPGSFIAYEDATISIETPGTVAVIRVKEGSRVRQGEVLVLLDKTKMELAVRQAEAALAQAQANFERAKSELARKQILLSDRTISQGTFDTFKAQHDSAAAAVDGADSSLALARQRLADMTVVAPFAGVIEEKMISVGEYVRPADPLLVLIQVDPLKLQFEVPEKHAARLEVGQEVRTAVSALPGKIFRGEITTIFPSLAVQSRTIRVEAQVPNPEFRLKPGFYASVQVPLSQVPGSMVVPRSALFRREGTENVFVLEGDRAESVVVQVGGNTSDKVEILSGLSPTDRVIISRVDTLRSGDRVKVGS
jgi:membrane fusion protein (multidrug efflux system)